MIQAMFVGGYILMMLSLGTFLCPARIRSLSHFGLFVLILVPVTFAAVPPVHLEPLPPSQDFQVPFTLYYLTKLLAWGLAPCLTIWAAMSRWGIVSVDWLTKKRQPDLSKDPECASAKVDSI